MEIVFLDGMTVGGGLSFEAIKKIGNLNIYDKTDKTNIKERIKLADVIITNKVYIGQEEISYTEHLKLICVAATGYNNIDIAEAEKKGIIVANVKNYSTESVVAVTFSLILELAVKTSKYAKASSNGEWSKSPMFTLLKYPVNELAGKKLGIIGYGTIGRRVGEVAKAFGMEILAASREGAVYPEKRYPIDEVLRNSDIVTIHTPLTDSTKGIIGRKELQMMKPEAYIINTARGGIIDEEALYEALTNKTISGAGLDVMTIEPPDAGNKLFKLDNIVVTPHIAWASQESRQRLLNGIADNIQKFITGKEEEIKIKN